MTIVIINIRLIRFEAVTGPCSCNIAILGGTTIEISGFVTSKENKPKNNKCYRKNKTYTENI